MAQLFPQSKKVCAPRVSDVLPYKFERVVECLGFPPAHECATLEVPFKAIGRRIGGDHEGG